MQKLIILNVLGVLLLGGGCAPPAGDPEESSVAEIGEQTPPPGEPPLDLEPEVDPEISPELLAIISYRMGYSFGLTWAQQELEPDDEELMMGLRDGVAGADRKFPKREMDQAYQTFMTKVRARRKTWALRNLEAGKLFLAENAERPGVISRRSGLQYEVVREGEGDKPDLEDRALLHYRAYRIDGREIESTYWQDQPPGFVVRGTLEGWKEALQLMRVGSRWKLFLPPHLAYGEPGYKGFIQPNDTLIYEIELHGIEEPANS